jgi:hypothetical protein
LEQEDGRVDEARRLFQLASAADPQHLYVWQVSARLSLTKGCFLFHIEQRMDLRSAISCIGRHYNSTGSVVTTSL